MFSVAVPNAAKKIRLRCGGGVSFDRRYLENVELFVVSSERSVGSHTCQGPEARTFEKMYWGSL